MAMMSLLYGKNKTTKSIGGIIIDGFINESYSFSNEVTEIPIEDGSSITDNITSNPDEITIEGFFGKYEFESNNLPSTLFSLSKLENLPDKKQRIKKYYQQLKYLKESKEPVTIVTGLDTFPDMIITELSIPRDVSTGADLHFSMTVKKLPIVRSEIVTISIKNVPESSAKNTIQSTAETGVQAKQEAKDDLIKQTRKEWVKSGRMSKERFLELYPNDLI